jgi:hypothetical protein
MRKRKRTTQSGELKAINLGPWEVLRFTLCAFSCALLYSSAAQAALWSGILDPSRAIDWTGVGFTIPDYTANCPTQPSLTANDQSAAATNTAAIQTALASCDATHNVVNIPAGTYYVAGWTYGPQGHQVVRGAGPMSTYLYMTAEQSCGGLGHAVCMINTNYSAAGSSWVLPPDGTQQCLWTGTNGVVGTYAKGAMSIILNNCPGGGPPVNQTLILDQADDVASADPGGVMICGDVQPGCTIETGDEHGRQIGGITHSHSQVVYVTNVSGSGTGPYTVTISPGVYANNIRSSQSPGAWWPGTIQNTGIEGMTIDGTGQPDGTLGMFSCYQCWAKNMRFLNGGRNHILFFQSAQDVVRDSYFYGAQGTGSQSYGIEFEIASGVLTENNIFQQTTAPIMFGTGSGCVVGYNFTIDDVYENPNYAIVSSYGHSPGNQMTLFEGNNLTGISSDLFHGTTALGTFFRNMLIGWQEGRPYGAFNIALRARHRAFNIIGNVMGQPGHHDTYEDYATSATSGVNATKANTSLYELGWVDNGFDTTSSCDPVVTCDPLVRSTLMRWGNYDVVTNGVKWDPTEASPAVVPYVNANFTPLYFSSLAQTLPPSLYYSSKPSWWPAAKAWPPIGPDVSAGNLGICSGTYAGAQATAGGQCAGGSLSNAWAAHANSIPAQDCYLNVMGGPPDGSGNVLSFDAAACYGTGGGTANPPPPGNQSGAVFSPRVYPNPWRKDKHDGKPVTFLNLPSGSTVKIFSVSGHQVKSLDGSTGNATWDLMNDSGDKVASGIYVYLITDSQGDKGRGKMAVIR